MLMELELPQLLAPDVATSSRLWGTNTGCQGKSACTPSWLGVYQVKSPTMFPAWERVPALLSSWVVSTAYLGMSAYTPS